MTPCCIHGTCNICGTIFKRTYPRHRKCDECRWAHRFKCVRCRVVYVRNDDIKLCGECWDILHKLPYEGLPSNILSMTGCGLSRGDSIDSGAINSHIIRESERIEEDRTYDGERGDYDDFENLQAQSETPDRFSGLLRQELLGCAVPEAGREYDKLRAKEEAKKMPRLDLSKDTTDAQWLRDGRILDTWSANMRAFLTTPVPLLMKRTGWSRATVYRQQELIRKSAGDSGLLRAAAKFVEDAVEQERERRVALEAWKRKAS